MTEPKPPVVEFAFPGPLRDRIVAAILDGSKTSTTSTVAEYEIENEPLPTVGTRGTVIDSDGRPVAVIETTDVRIVRLEDVDLHHVLAEGEGHRSVAAWREAHESFWASQSMHQVLKEAVHLIDDDTPVVLETFTLVGTAVAAD
ncbi:Uncharacterized protein YhfF [Agreia bicolorata]|uniref:Uncharacterized protein YhfF n=1 Tax=Agreia bicolorata TaxID=110935 RepID=A0A1T4XKS6_9MICO|nr:ASCH domain-containing protein [Agreia bicolorata]SKA90150.1 Uncharacterized protein YhfF [Agreia bicolorata]